MSDPRAEYTRRLSSYAEIASAKNRAHVRIGNFKLGVVVAGLLLFWLCFHNDAVSSYWLFVPVGWYAALAIAHEQILRAKSRAETSASFYRKGIARIDDQWPGTGQTGERFRDDHHVYAADLDLFGPRSLFELLSTARLPMGENRLAHWLKFPSAKEEILERQRLVAELREKLDLHRDLAVTGEELRARLNPESLVGWAEAPPTMPGIAVRAAALLLVAAAVSGVVIYGVWSIAWPFFLALIAELLFRRWLLRRAESVIHGISCNGEGLALFADILQRIEREPFNSPRLQALVAQLQRNGQSASAQIRNLARIVYWIDGHHSLIGHLVELPLLYSIQLAFAAAAWRRRGGARMRAWVDVAGEMEALISLATYSLEHPQDPFPEFVEFPQSRAFLDGHELGHPLIVSTKCVRNSVRLDDATRVLLVSGSNMSGKSTLLRAVGINAVLAMAGAPVRAKALRLTPLQIGTRIRSTDSLQEGRSTFYTEILHIRKVFDLAADGGGTPLLFLFDELLEGTNSHDRRIGAENLLRALLQRGAMGIVTTHDLALTEITAAVGQTLRNKHFEDQVAGGRMQFDYKLRDGVVTKSNALELMRIVGLEM